MVGRKEELTRLYELANSEESEFVAVYGRRRVGKTYLVRTAFEGEFTMAHAGVAKVGMKMQLQAFRASLREAGHRACPALANWLDAFEELKVVIKASDRPKKIIFIDEMPWMDTPRSNFVPALEHFWNGWASARTDILLIVCGSATSWIISKIIRSHGGLHNRVTEQIPLAPFTLAECDEYARSRGLEFTHAQLAELYMVFGGVPYYWRFLRRGMSPAQDIDALLFNGKGRLVHEFEDLYASLFKHPEPHLAIVEALGKKAAGISRDEVAVLAGLANGGGLTRALTELEQCGFIRKYHVCGKAANGALYQLIDNFTLFYYRFMRENVERKSDFWSSNVGRPIYFAWRGLAFERLCLLHVHEIKRAMKVEGVSSSEYAWRSHTAKPGAQIDLLIDRADGIIDLCEMKCTDDPFELDAGELARLRHRRSAFQEKTATRKAVHLVMVSAAGLKENAFAHDVAHVVTLDDFMQTRS